MFMSMLYSDNGFTYNSDNNLTQKPQKAIGVLLISIVIYKVHTISEI